MFKIDFSDMIPKARKPTKKEAARYRRWVSYLKNSRLSEREIYSRAAQYTERGEEPKYD